MTKTDRRIQRTREVLQKALIELISERGYDAITIQDIVDRANVGRTTFYLHYRSKDDLFMSCHEANLRAAFAEADSAIPFDVLANYLAGAQIALVQWWLEKRQPYTPENLAQTFHRLQRAAIRDAFGLRDGE